MFQMCEISMSEYSSRSYILALALIHNAVAPDMPEGKESAGLHFISKVFMSISAVSAQISIVFP